MCHSNESVSLPEDQFKKYLLDDSTYSLTYEMVDIDAREVIVQEGQDMDKVYIIVSGAVEERRYDNVVHILGENEFIALGAMTGLTEARTTAVALTKTKLYKFDAQDVLDKLHERHYGMGILVDVLTYRMMSLKQSLSE